MIENKTEIWRSHPDIVGIEVSTLGRVRVLDKVTSSEKRTQFVKGHVLKPWDNGHGYMLVKISIAGKWATKSIHQLVAQTFISNPDNLTEVNHKNCNRSDNRVSNLEFCTHEYNMAYKEKYGKVKSKPVLALNLSTFEVSRFQSQSEVGRVLGLQNSNINAVIKGKIKQTGGYWFINDDDKADDAIKCKLHTLQSQVLGL